MKLGKYSFGIGDRFGKQGKPQLAAIIQAKEAGVDITPVWNKSHREHEIIGTAPYHVRQEADASVQALKWEGSYYVDADHVGMKTVDLFLEASDFFTLDVADFISKPAESSHIEEFVKKHRHLAGQLTLPGLNQPLPVTENDIRFIAQKYLFAAEEAGRIYRYILQKNGTNNFIIEVSMDETNDPQTPIELFFILSMISQENIPVQTIAPKFSGRFNKGVDYIGEINRFEMEFEQDLSVIQAAIETFSLSENLKLSVHSGSDKFTIYESIRNTLKRTNAGLHIKTAGTTWLEELIGLAEAGGEGLSLATEIYCRAYKKRNALCQPYATVIDIDENRLPKPDQVKDWDSETFVSNLRHNPNDSRYNPHFRQLLHVGYKIAAQMEDQYLNALDEYEEIIARNVTENLLKRHIQRIFLS